MNGKKGEAVVLSLLFMPVVMAIFGLIIKFNEIDFVYLLLVFIIYIRYYFKAKL
ncbi:MAG: hypothetical protein RSB71_01440 [Bacilli bacterium]